MAWKAAKERESDPERKKEANLEEEFDESPPSPSKNKRETKKRKKGTERVNHFHQRYDLSSRKP